MNESIDAVEEAELQKFAISQAKEAVKSGNVTGPGWKAAAKNNPYTQLFIGLTPDESKLQTANKQLLQGTKGVFGPKPTEREIFLLLNQMLPSIGKTEEANLAGLDFVEKVNDMKLLHGQIVQELTNGGTKYVPDLERQVNERMKPLQQALIGELQEAVEKYASPKSEEGETKKSDSPIKVKAPDGSFWNMTQTQIDDAKKKGVIFEPI